MNVHFCGFQAARIHNCSECPFCSRLEPQVVLSSTLSGFTADMLIVEAANSQRQVVSFSNARCACCLGLRNGLLACVALGPLVDHLYFPAFCRWPVRIRSPAGHVIATEPTHEVRISDLLLCSAAEQESGSTSAGRKQVMKLQSDRGTSKLECMSLTPRPHFNTGSPPHDNLVLRSERPFPSHGGQQGKQLQPNMEGQLKTSAL